MNTNDPLESQMRSWTPRRPSPALERRLFGAAATADDDAPRALGLGWLAPVACVLMVALQLTGSGSAPALSRSGNSDALLTTASLSNQSLSAYAPGWSHSARNGVSQDTFASTNPTPAPSPMRTLPVFLTLTNGLIH